MPTTVVSSGRTSRGTVLERGDAQQVYGTAIGTKVHAGGRETVLSGGVASATMVIGNRDDTDDLAALVVSSGGSARGTTMLSRGRLIVESGGETWNTVVNEQGSDVPTSYEIVSAGGVTKYTVLNDRGWEAVACGSSSRDTHVDGGWEQVVAGGTASHTTVDAGTLAMVGGTAIDTRVNGGGSELVYPGATAVDTVVNGSLRVVSAGRFVLDAEVTVHEGGVAIDTTLGNVASIAIDNGTLAFRGGRHGADHLPRRLDGDAPARADHRVRYHLWILARHHHGPRRLRPGYLRLARGE